MSYDTLLHNLGFETDPFLKTNADEEDRLEEYFIAPPFSTPYMEALKPLNQLWFLPQGVAEKLLLKEKSNYLVSTNHSYA